MLRPGRTAPCGGLVLAAALLLGCELPAKEYGALAFHDPDFSGNQLNSWSCHTCHATRDGDARLLPGAPMRGVTAREGWYGGRAQGLFDAVQSCFTSFMRGAPLVSQEPRARALYEYLASLEGEPSPALPFTLVEMVLEVPRGDAQAGAEVYRRACQDCHGALHTGEGRNTSRAPVLPEVAGEYPRLYSGVSPALLVGEKVRHGQFFGIGGDMPPWSQEALSDEELGALLSHLGL